MTQPPFVQVVSATCLVGSAVHLMPQPPQLLGSASVWVSQPLVASLLQFLYLSGSKCKGRQLVVINTGGEKS
jgi:hypothetical protein